MIKLNPPPAEKCWKHITAVDAYTPEYVNAIEDRLKLACEILERCNPTDKQNENDKVRFERYMRREGFLQEERHEQRQENVHAVHQQSPKHPLQQISKLGRTQ